MFSMIKKTTYGKTKRFQESEHYFITEKIDGSNLGVLKKDGKIYYAMRNRIVEIEDIENISYKGLSEFKDNNKQFFNLLESMEDGQGFYGEWVGMGQIKYDTPVQFYIFAKIIDVSLDFETKKSYNLADLEFRSETIQPVPVVSKKRKITLVEDIDKLYDEYTLRVGRKVEGFILHSGAGHRKYVRYKNGKETPHTVK